MNSVKKLGISMVAAAYFVNLSGASDSFVEKLRRMHGNMTSLLDSDNKLQRTVNRTLCNTLLGYIAGFMLEGVLEGTQLGAKIDANHINVRVASALLANILDTALIKDKDYVARLFLSICSLVAADHYNIPSYLDNKRIRS